MPDSAVNNSTRITNRMIYDRQEILIAKYHAVDKQQGIDRADIENNEKAIDALEKKSNKVDSIIAGVGALITAALTTMRLIDK